MYVTVHCIYSTEGREEAESGGVTLLDSLGGGRTGGGGGRKAAGGGGAGAAEFHSK